MKVLPSICTRSITVYPSRSYGALHTVKRCDGLSRISFSAGKNEKALMSRPSVTMILKMTPVASSVKPLVAPKSVLVLEKAPHWIGRPSLYCATVAALSGAPRIPR